MFSREKARIPAWCDRIVWKGENLRPVAYDTADLRFSDHRPVYAIFECKVTVEDDAKKADLSRELYRRRLAGALKDESSTDSDEGEGEREYEKLDIDVSSSNSDPVRWWLKNGEIDVE